MNRTSPPALALILALTAGACSEVTTTSEMLDPSLDAAFSTLPTGYASTTNTFAGADSVWTPEAQRHRRHHRPGGHLIGGGLMGGGLHGIFMGDGFGIHHVFAPFGVAGRFADCSYDAALERIVCPTVDRNGVLVDRSIALFDSNGTVQDAFDAATTNTANVRTSVEGTLVRRFGTTTIDHESDRTVSGLAPGSTERLIDGASEGRETSVGTNEDGEFTVVRVVGDTIRGIVLPVPTGDRRPFPKAGTLIRSMTVTLSEQGQPDRSRTRREVVTYDGSDTANLEITVNGETKTCSLPLPFGRPDCSE